MNSQIFLFIFSLQSFLFSQIFLDQNEEKAEANRRKLSHIKSCTKQEYSYSFGKMSNVGKILEFCEYNRDGFYTFKKAYTDEEVSSYEVCEYDGQNNMIMFSEFDSFNKLIYKRANRYVDNLHTESVNFDKYGNYHFKEVYKYDTHKNCIGKDVFSWDGNLFYKHIYNYEQNKLVEQIFYDTLGNVKGKIIYEYSKNRKSKESNYDNNGQMFEESIYEYPAKNKLKIQTNYYFTELSPEPVITNKTKIFNDKNLLIEEYSEKENKIVNWRIIYRYDKNGNILEEIHNNALDETISSIIYKYDFYSE